MFADYDKIPELCVLLTDYRTMESNVTTIKVEIITIGDEILIGQIVDTNSAWMATQLNQYGFEIHRITSVHDNGEQIKAAVRHALSEAHVVLLTGGIGPTKDDITKQTLCELFNTQLVYSQAVYENIMRLFKHRPHVMNPLTAAQAMVPEKCTVIQNEVGTAPVTWFEHEGKVVVSMPGVPYEMKHNMSSQVIPRLAAYFNTPHILHQTVLTYGIPESQLAITLTDWENSLPEHIHLAYLPNNGLVKLRLSGTSNDEDVLAEEIDALFKKLPALLGNAIIAHEDITPQAHLGALLRERRLTIGTAESCTGGNIAHLITSVAGSSSYFKGGVVAYSNEVKTEVLGVKEEDIVQEGAVSQTVVEQMAEGVRERLKTDYGIATSGIAGPDGGSDEKPVGTVWIAVASSEKTISKRYQFGQLREQNINRATQAAIVMLIQLLQE